MTTDIGKELRKLRIDQDERLMDMADRLGKSASFISAVEVGRKAVPVGFEEDVIREYNLQPTKAEALRSAADRTRRIFTVEALSDDARLTAGMFARHIGALSDNDLKRVQAILRGKRE